MGSNSMMAQIRSRTFVLAVLLLAVCLLVTVVIFWNRRMPIQTPDFSKLADGVISGEWIRNEQGRDTSDWRNFSNSGDFSVRYGDMVIQGRYRVLGQKQLETSDRVYGQPDKVYRWTFGFDGEKLVMVNQDTGWIEEYRPAKTR